MSTPDFTAPAPPTPTLGSPFKIGAAAIALFFGGFGAWAVSAPLSAAAHAAGQVRAESYRKTVQHLEGGIIEEILVKEGQSVRKGDVLIRLDDTQSGANADLLSGQYAALLALEARLIAERDGRGSIAFPAELLSRRGDPHVAEILRGQQTIFATRDRSLGGQGAVLDQRVLQLNSEIDAYRAQMVAADEQARLIREEMKGVKFLLDQGLERKPRYLALERQLASLEGSKGQYAGMIARAQQSIGEARLQKNNVSGEQSKEVTAELRDVQTKLEELRERMRAAVDVRGRTAIVAPQSGRVVNVRFVTPGGVIAPGAPVLDIVPQGDALVVDARVSPLDIDTVHPGLDAEVKFSSFKQRTVPVLIGEVTQVSADALTEERTGESYYVAQVVLPPAEAKKLDKLKLYPGMPAEVFIITGKRKAIDYFLDPMRDSFRRALRED